MIQALAAGEKPQHPVLEAPGWWRRERQLATCQLYSAAARPLVYLCRIVVNQAGSEPLHEQ